MNAEEEEERREEEKLEKKLKEKEAAYQERLKIWETREKKKIREAEKDRERERDRIKEQVHVSHCFKCNGRILQTNFAFVSRLKKLKG